MFYIMVQRFSGGLQQLVVYYIRGEANMAKRWIMYIKFDNIHVSVKLFTLKPK